MASERHVSPSGLEFPNPRNSVEHGDVAPIYVSPEEMGREAVRNPTPVQRTIRETGKKGMS